MTTDLANLASSTIASDLSATAKSIAVHTGDGAKFPATVPYEVILGGHAQNAETALVTAISSDTLTLVRRPNSLKWASGSPIATAIPDPWGLGAIVSQSNAAAPLILKGNSAQALVTSGTITTAGLSISRVSLASANASSVVLQAGTVDGQVVIVENTSGTYTVTFAAAGTSNVQDGASDVIAVSTAWQYVWNNTTGHWVHLV